MKQTNFNIALLLTITISSIITNINTINNLDFYVEPKDKLCLHEYFSDKTLVVFETTPRFKDHNSIIIRDPENKKLRKVENQEHFKESFTTYTGGYYEICFMNSHPEEKQKFSFDMKSGIAAKDYSQVPKMKDLKPIEVDLQKLKDKSDEYFHLLNYANGHEAKYESLQESVKSSFTFFTMIVIGLMIVVGGLEAFLAKNIINSRKLR